MNANTIAVEAASLVSQNTKALSVKAIGSSVTVSMVRDPMDSKAWANYLETCARVGDALKALRAAYAVRHNSGCEIRTRGMFPQEFYSADFTLQQ